jgi:hypothetical protein
LIEHSNACIEEEEAEVEEGEVVVGEVGEMVVVGGEVGKVEVEVEDQAALQHYHPSHQMH